MITVRDTQTKEVYKNHTSLNIVDIFVPELTSDVTIKREKEGKSTISWYEKTSSEELYETFKKDWEIDESSRTQISFVSKEDFDKFKDRNVHKDSLVDIFHRQMGYFKNSKNAIIDFADVYVVSMTVKTELYQVSWDLDPFSDTKLSKVTIQFDQNNETTFNLEQMSEEENIIWADTHRYQYYHPLLMYLPREHPDIKKEDFYKHTLFLGELLSMAWSEFDSITEEDNFTDVDIPMLAPKLLTRIYQNSQKPDIDREEVIQELKKEALDILESAQRSGQIIKGRRKSVKAIKSKEAKLVFIAENSNYTGRILRASNRHSIPYLTVEKSQIYDAIGGEGSSVVAIIQPGTSMTKFYKLLDKLLQVDSPDFNAKMEAQNE